MEDIVNSISKEKVIAISRSHIEFMMRSLRGMFV